MERQRGEERIRRGEETEREIGGWGGWGIKGRRCGTKLVKREDGARSRQMFKKKEKKKKQQVGGRNSHGDNGRYG